MKKEHRKRKRREKENLNKVYKSKIDFGYGIGITDQHKEGWWTVTANGMAIMSSRDKKSAKDYAKKAVIDIIEYQTEKSFLKKKKRKQLHKEEEE